MTEEELYQRWFAWARAATVIATGGHRLCILDAGRLNRVYGPDIPSARFELDGIVYQGAVEFHTALRDWYGHGHHLDPAYAGVLLHLCASEENRPLTPVRHHSSARGIPSLALPPPPRRTSLCALHSGKKPVSGEALRRLAAERLSIKVRAFTARLEHTLPEEVFYRHFLRILGYPHNGAAFEALALAAPFSEVQGLFEAGFPAEGILAGYAGQAGFLPLAHPDAYARRLAALYRGLRCRFSRAPLQPGRWTLAALRYHNHPHFRLAGWAHLLAGRGLRFHTDLWDILAARPVLSALRMHVRDYFTVSVPEYWQTHFALGRRCRTSRRRFFGPERISEILVNLLIPFFTARAAATGSAGFVSYLEDLYLNWPSGGCYGFAQRQFPAICSALPGRPRAFYNQAMLQLHRSYCLPGCCSACPLRRKTLTSAY